VRLNNGKGFDHFLKVKGNYLPSPRKRWCTQSLKIQPFEAYVGNDNVISYIGIRADENRDGYISTKNTIKPIFPFISDGIIRDDVFRILEETIGIPEYYRWRDRSGCFFCFFQKRREWLGLKREHPDLFERAKEYEKSKEGYTWVQGMTLDEVVARAEMAEGKEAQSKDGQPSWQEIIRYDKDDDDPEDQACLICSL
jgi:3'-phosphoadenosine 5'-phosphosulfate sulfotransferase (PAPS reductase)/FAD synthetase